MHMEMVLDLGVLIMGLEKGETEGLSGRCAKAPHLATMIGAAEVVMATMEEEIVEVELTVTLEIISSNLTTVDKEWKLW